MQSGVCGKWNVFNPEGVECDSPKNIHTFQKEFLTQIKTMSRYRQIFYQIIFGTSTGSRRSSPHFLIPSSEQFPVDYIKDIKVASSGWMKASGKFQKFEA